VPGGSRGDVPGEDAEVRRSLEMENSGATAFADHGYQIQQNPTKPEVARARQTQRVVVNLEDWRGDMSALRTSALPTDGSAPKAVEYRLTLAGTPPSTRWPRAFPEAGERPIGAAPRRTADHRNGMASTSRSFPGRPAIWTWKRTTERTNGSRKPTCAWDSGWTS
jgi:hypothetical protein